jgi:Domain of unknown function (DUF4411)
MASDNTNSNIYFIDTSALVSVFRSNPVEVIDRSWEKLEELFLNGRMFSHQIVYDEITTDSKRPDLLSKKITPVQAYFKPMSFEQAQSVSNIIKKFPALIDPKNEKEQAHPWLIAAATLEQNQLSLFNPDKKVYIVSEQGESETNIIPSVCEGLGLGYLRLSDFYRLNNWAF